MLSKATFDQIIELPGGGSKLGAAILIIEGGRGGGGVYMIFATQHWGCRLG